MKGRVFAAAAAAAEPSSSLLARLNRIYVHTFVLSQQLTDAGQVNATN